MKFNEKLISLPAGVAVFAFLALAGLMGLFALTAVPSAEAQESSSIKFPEGSTDAVATLTAIDPEEDTVTWSVTGGADQGLFTIGASDGVLKFQTPPDYEAAGTDNNHEVVVTATDTATPTNNTATFTVNVEVTDVEEDGVVTWTVDHNADNTADTPTLLQFQPGAILTASLTDGDVDGDTKTVTNVRWQWYRSPSKTSMGTPISGATNAAYTVQDEANDNDVGMYLHVQASYNVVPGSPESASRVSDYQVQAYREDNSAPVFDPTAVTREVSEGMAGMAVGSPVTATDADGGALNYTLSGADRTQFEIDQKTGQITTLVPLNYDSTAAATDNCTALNSCVVEVTATDSAGAATTTVATVTIEIEDVDEMPMFTAGVEAASVAENTTEVDADAYTATDPEGNAVSLTLEGDDKSMFRLGVGRVLSFTTMPDYENPMDMDGNNRYQVTVRAWDGAMYADREVTVTVTDADEGPEITEIDSPIEYAEGGTGAVAMLTAIDPEGDMVTWSAGTGDDSASFAIDSAGVLTFATSPDYENATDADTDNTYEVTVMAASTGASGSPITDTFDVAVEVTDVAENGVVTWTVDHNADDTADTPTLLQFQPGAILTASLTDGDVEGADKAIENDNIVWRWYRSSSKTGAGTPISGATSATYTVQDEANNNDVGRYLGVRASYSVVSGTGDSASRVSDYPVQVRLGENNSAPVFDPTTVTREVSEGMTGMAVGAPVTATDADGDVLNYTLGGTDVTEFEIDQETGQITTSVALDYDSTADATDNCTALNSCVVEVTATDSAGAATATVATVTITVKDVDEEPTFSTGPTAIRRAENLTALADSGAEGEVTYTATDQDGNLVNLSLMGDDESMFRLGVGGVLSFMTAPDFENPTDMNRDNKYQVTVRASDGTMYADQMVTVTVTDVNEEPEIMEGGLIISGMSNPSIEENTSAVATYKLTGPNADMATWTLEGADAASFMVNSDGMLSFMSAPDYEMPRGMAMSDDNTNTYMVTLKADDGTYMDTHDVEVTVTDMEEAGTVMLDSNEPLVGSAITATLTDSDGGVMDVTWTWETSSDMSAWTAGSGTATASTDMMMSTYMPHTDDGGMYLRATAEYTDRLGSGQSASEAATSKVVDDPQQALIAQFDANGNGSIDRSEMIAAINAYLFDGTISRADMIAIINLYLFG